MSMPWSLLTEQKIFYCQVLPDKNHTVSNTPVSHIKKLKCDGKPVQHLVCSRSRDVNPNQDQAGTRIPRSPWATPNQRKF